MNARPQIVSHYLTVLLVSFLLAACGGGSGQGSGGGTPTPSPLRDQDPLVFSSATVTMSLADEAQANSLSGGSGTGAVTYSSSDIAVATVETSTGTVTPLSLGSTTITVTKEADSNYRAAQASYTLEVVKQEQPPLGFAQDRIEIYIDESVPENPVSGGAGTGALQFTTDNEAVAEVAEDGQVSVVGEGTATIVVTKAEDEQYRSASAEYTLVINKYLQDALVFELDEVSGAVTASAPENPLAGGSGQGEVSFFSSNEAIAAVDANSGEVRLVDVGTAIITASKAEDERYYSTTASYEVTAYEVVSDLSIGVGLTATEIEWSSQVGVIETIRTSDFYCDIDNYASCSNSWGRTINNEDQVPYLDTFPQIGTLAYLHLQNSDYRADPLRLEAKSTDVPSRMWHEWVAFKDRLWIIGGASDELDSSGESSLVGRNDIWSSEDGIHWQLETNEADFEPRNSSQVLVYKNELYLFSGYIREDGAVRTAMDVWKSADGVNWTLLTQESSPVVNSYDLVVVFKDKLWAVTGLNSHPENGVWSSEDGINWQLEVTIPPFEMRDDFALYANSEKMYLAGGRNNNTNYTDVWSTSDGIEWNRETAQAGYEAFLNVTVVPYEGKFYAFGGLENHPGYAPLYVSTDGVSWVSQGALNQIEDGYHKRVAIFKNKLWMAVLAGPKRYIWYSSDGKHWRVPVDTGNLQWHLRE